MNLCREDQREEEEWARPGGPGEGPHLTVRRELSPGVQGKHLQGEGQVLGLGWTWAIGQGKDGHVTGRVVKMSSAI